MDASHAKSCPRCGRGWQSSLSRCGWCGTLRQPQACASHPSAVAPRACAVCGTPLCDRCDRGNRHASLCETHAGVRILQGWAEIDRPKDELRAEVIAGALRASGLDAQLLSQTDHANVVGVGGLAVVRVLVPAYQYGRARELLAERDIEPREEVADPRSARKSDT